MTHEEEAQQYNWPATLAFLGGLALFFLWRRRRRRKRLEKMVREARRRAEAREGRRKARGKKERVKGKPARRKADRRRRKEKEKASMLSQLVRFAVFQFLKKVITEQINRIELDLQKSPLGARLTASSKPQEAST